MDENKALEVLTQAAECVLRRVPEAPGVPNTKDLVDALETVGALRLHRYHSGSVRFKVIWETEICAQSAQFAAEGAVHLMLNPSISPLRLTCRRMDFDGAFPVMVSVNKPKVA